MHLFTRRLFSLLWLLLPAALSAADPVVQAFTFTEPFGVSHASQVISFALKQPVDPAACYLENESGAEIPFQRIAGGAHGEIAFVTDMPAYASKTFTLRSGRAPQIFSDTVAVNESATGVIEITNGLTGVRVPKVYAPLTITPKNPVQGIRFRDGTWSPAGDAVRTGHPAGYTPAVSSITTMAVDFLERGPIKTTVRVRYTFQLNNAVLSAQGDVIHPAGPCFLATTFEIQRGQPTVLMEVETDYYFDWTASLHQGIQPTHTRYRGHSATSAAFGTEADGSVYYNTNWDHDAQPIAIDFTRSTGPDSFIFPNPRGLVSMWDIWAYNQGFYHLFNQNGPATGNLVTLFSGPAGRARAQSGFAVGLYSRPGPDSGIAFSANLWAGTYSLYNATPEHTMRGAWGIYVGTRADLPAPSAITYPALHQACIHLGGNLTLGGGVNLNTLAHYQLDYPDPVPGFGGMYLGVAGVAAMKQRARTDTAYYNYLRNTQPNSRPIFEMWLDPTGAKARPLVDALLEEGRDIIHSRANGYPDARQAWLVVEGMKDRLDQCLGYEYLAPADKTKLKALAAFYANWLWSNDAYPLQDAAGLNLGSANMPVQWTGARYTYTWLLSSHPVIKTRLAEAVPRFWALNAAGVSNATPHYAGTITPMHNAVMQRAVLGYSDYATDPKLPGFADWYMNLISPPDGRFGGQRRVMTLNNSSYDASPLFGDMATASARALPDLSARLMDVWHGSLKPHDDFYGTTLLRINEDLPAVSARLGNKTWSGYNTVLRHAYGTPSETSAMIVDGSWYTDHRGGEAGHASLYALSAPLSLFWQSIYSPPAGSGDVLNQINRESDLLAAGYSAWNADTPVTANQVGTVATAWNTDATKEEFLDLSTTGYIRVTHRRLNAASDAWTRELVSVHPVASEPIFLLNDSFAGALASQSLVKTQLQVATGAVATPAGSVTPVTRFWAANGTKQGPSGGTAYTLSAGLNKLGFTGQTMTPGIDWDHYELTASSQQFSLGNWGHDDQSTCIQHILRVRGSGADGFRSLIVPRRKGAAAPTVTLDGSVVQIVTATGTTRVAPHGYTFTSATRDVVVSFGATEIALPDGLAVSGGPAEVVWDKSTSTLSIAAHGAAGARSVRPPSGAWQLWSGSATAAAGRWSAPHPGGAVGSSARTSVQLGLAALAAPLAPASLAAASYNGDRVRLTWTDAAHDEAGYIVERVTDGGAPVELARLPADATSYIDATALPDSALAYRIRAFNTAGSADAAVETTLIPTLGGNPLGPTAPSGLQTRATPDVVRLDWTDNAADEIAYKVERKTQSVAGGAYAVIATLAANATTHIDRTVSANQLYAYRIRATNAQGSSAPSAEAEADTRQPGTAASFRLFETLLPAPGFDNLTDGGAAYELGVEFRSSSAGAITHVRYYRAPSETGAHTGRIWSASGALLASVAFTGETSSGWQQQALATPLSIQPGVSYTVSVNVNSHYAATTGGLATSVTGGPLATVANGNNGRYGNPGAFPTGSYQNTNYFRDVLFSAASVTAPAALAVQRDSATQATLSWTDTTTLENGFLLERSPDAGATWQGADLAPINATSRVLTGLASGAAYRFRLTATSSGGASPAVTIDLPASAPSPLQTWRQTHFGPTATNTGPSADLADPDADGVVNLLEYAFAADPLAPGSAGFQPALQVSGLSSPPFFTLTFLRARADLTYIVQASSDLLTWTDLSTNPGAVSTTVPVVFTDSVPLSDSAASPRFLRLKVTTP